MKKFNLIFIIFLLFFAGCNTLKQENFISNNSNMEITSSAFTQGNPIPAKYTCDGINVNPPLNFEGIPVNSKSLALIFDDPDAPAGVWSHWILWNIDPKTTKILENSVPDGAVQGLNDSGENQYDGPCPPSGTHKYVFKLYALDQELSLTQSTNEKALESAIKGHIIDQAELTGKYSRTK